VVEAVQSGVTDYLGKPFSSEQLINKVVSAARSIKSMASYRHKNLANPLRLAALALRHWMY